MLLCCCVDAVHGVCAQKNESGDESGDSGRKKAPKKKKHKNKDSKKKHKRCVVVCGRAQRWWHDHSVLAQATERVARF